MKNSSEDKKKTTKNVQKRKKAAKNSTVKSKSSGNKAPKQSSRESQKTLGKRSKSNTSKKSGSGGSANEVFFVLGLAFSAFLMVSLHTDWAGKLGEMFKHVFLGLFSNVGFVFPYIFILLSFALFVPKFSEYKKQIYASSISVFVFLSVFQGMFNLQDLSSVFWDMNYLKFAYENGIALSGNGAFGAFFISLLYRPIGIAGLIIILLLAVASIFIFAFYGKPSEVVEKYGTKAFHKTKKTLGEAKGFALRPAGKEEAHASVKYNTNTILDEINKDHLFEQKLKNVNKEFEDVLHMTQFEPFDDQLEEFTIHNYQDSYHYLQDLQEEQNNSVESTYLKEMDANLSYSDESLGYEERSFLQEDPFISAQAQNVPREEEYRTYKNNEEDSHQTNESINQSEKSELSDELVIEFGNHRGELYSGRYQSELQSDEVVEMPETENQTLSDIKISDLKEEDFEVYEADPVQEKKFSVDESSIDESWTDGSSIDESWTDGSSIDESRQKSLSISGYEEAKEVLGVGFSGGTKHVPSPNFTFDLPKNAIEISQPVATADYFGALESTPKKEMEIDNESKLKFLYENYKLPDLDLLKEGKKSSNKDDEAEILANVNKLRQTFQNFKIDAKITEVSKGPMITRFEIQPNAGVKVSKIVGLSDDIALNLAATSVRIVAPIPGKSAIGIEIPNKSTSVVSIKDVVSTPKYKKEESLLRFGLGLDISGEPIVADLAKMPHLLIAGATGSGKSVCVNTIIASILLNAKPDEVKFLMIDPKVVELNVYNGIAHLILPVVTDPKKASLALNWAVNEMTQRYAKFAKAGVKDIAGYNRKFELEENSEYMPRIVVIIDELSDLMMAAPNQVEEAICRLAQMARACGIHLIVATQRPSVDVITGVIKANIPSRIAFAVSSQIDSRTIIDGSGAEKLLGKGDMLYYPSGMPKPMRVQGSFISEEEVEKMVEFISSQSEGIELYNEDLLEDVQSSEFDDSEVDELLPASIEFVIEAQKASTSLIQRKFRIGYNRAARIMEALEEREIVGPSRGSKPREVLIKSLD